MGDADSAVRHHLLFIVGKMKLVLSDLLFVTAELWDSVGC